MTLRYMIVEGRQGQVGRVDHPRGNMEFMCHPKTIHKKGRQGGIFFLFLLPLFSRVLRDSTPRFVRRSVGRLVGWSVGWSHFTFFIRFIPTNSF